MCVLSFQVKTDKEGQINIKNLNIFGKKKGQEDDDGDDEVCLCVYVCMRGCVCVCACMCVPTCLCVCAYVCMHVLFLSNCPLPWGHPSSF